MSRRRDLTRSVFVSCDHPPSPGLPLGVQVGAARGQDHLSIAVALELERAFGGWVPPDPLLHVP